MSERIARLTIVMMLVTMIASVIAASMLARPLVSGAPPHDSEGHAIGSLDARAAVLRGIVVPSVTASGPKHTIRLTVFADEEFIASAGAGWRDAASGVARSASDLLNQVGVGIRVVAVERWQSDNEISAMTTLLDNAIGQAGERGNSVPFFLTGQRTDTYDGWARPTIPAMLLRAGAPGSATLPSLVAHELGHILGLSHHENGHDCPAGGCLMESKGFAHAWTWCDDHKGQISEILASI